MSYVYVMRSGQYFKIGFTDGPPHKRLASLQTSSPQPVYLLGVIEGTKQDEARLHRAYSLKRSHGEWFTLTWEDVGDILVGSVAKQEAQPKEDVSPASIQERILAYLAGGNTCSGQEITARTGIPYMPTLRVQLQRMLNSGAITQPVRGHYRAAGLMQPESLASNSEQ